MSGLIAESLSPSEYLIQESASEVDGVYILARVVGPAFFPETVSGNKVRYPLKAWENAINDQDFKRRLEDRLVFGTIGHDPDLTDNDIRKGIFSHIVTKVWIDEQSGNGMAEYLVLNTDPGRVLNTLLRAKSKLRVSTRANGSFESGGVNKDGSKSVNSNDFKLERIDFVVDPGYVEALPKLLESNGSSEYNLKNKDNLGMSDQVVKLLEARVEELKGEKQISESVAKELTTSLSELTADKAKMSAIVESYQTLGSVATITEALAELRQYKTLGTVHQISEALEEGEEALSELTSQVDELVSGLEAAKEKEEAEHDSAESTGAYKDLGTPEEISDLLQLAQEMQTQLDEYKELGTPEEVKQSLEVAERMMKEAEESEISSLCSELGVDRSVVDTLLAKDMALEEIKTLLGAVKDSQSSESSYKESDDDDDDEDEDEKEMMAESLSSKLFKHTYSPKTQISESKKPAPVSRAAKLLSQVR